MNSKLIKYIFFTLSTTLLLPACDVKSPQRQDKPEAFDAMVVEEDQKASMPDPKVNILFVVDNSLSMVPYQQKLAENIELFANEFFDNTRIDYRIGVVSVYDSTFLDDRSVHPRHGLRKMNPLGQLTMISSDSQVKYITRETPNPKEALKRSVLIGVQWGPEAEESFSPVLAVIDPKRNHEINQDFYQKDAYLAVIFLTDADDVTFGLSGEDFYQRLVAEKNGDASKILIAAALPDLSNKSDSCKKDGDGPTQSFPTLLSASGGILANLCSDDFGTTLASFGNLLAQRVGVQRIALKYTPDINSLVVTYGPENQPESERQQLSREKNEYTFVPNINEVIINPKVNLKKQDNAKIWVTFKPASLANSKNGRLRTL